MKPKFTFFYQIVSRIASGRSKFPAIIKAISVAAILGHAPSATAQITNAAPYCQYNQGMTVHGFAGAISKVTLGTLSNATGLGNLATYSSSSTAGCQQLYNYYNTIAAPSLTTGANYTIELEFKSTYDGEPRWYAAYIDFNHNNVFDTTSEMIIDMAHANVIGYLPASTTPTVITTVRSHTFTVPASAITGTTRMRVIRSHRDYQWIDSVSKVDPCMGYPFTNTSSSNWYYGEVEDYNVTISAPAPPAPVIASIAATPVTQNTAAFKAVVNPNGLSLSVSFEYGVNTNYGNSINATPSPVTATVATPVATAVIAGLFPNNTYHYRVKAVAAGTTYYSADSVFKTLSTTAVGNTPDKEDMTIYPNPSTGLLNIDLHGNRGEVIVEVMNTTGAVVFTRKEQVNDMKTIDLEKLPSGLYHMQLSCGAKQYRTNICIAH